MKIAAICISVALVAAVVFAPAALFAAFSITPGLMTPGLGVGSVPAGNVAPGES
jgi:hypothetical protein